MMGLKIVIFALLLISLQNTVGDSSQAIPADDVSKIEKAELSHYLHHPHRRSQRGLLLRLFKHWKNKDKSKTPFSSNIKWEPFTNEGNIFSVSIKDNNYYIAIDKDCKPCLADVTTKKCESSSQKADRFLVNPDDIEDLDWKTFAFLNKPPFPVETCNGFIIARRENNLGYTKDTIFPKITVGSEEYKDKIEVLVLNYDNVKEEYLTNIQFNPELVQRNKKPDIFRNLTIDNHNCQVMKQQVKIDSSFEETVTYEIGNTLLIGGSVGFKIKDIAELGLKVDISPTEKEINSNIKKNDYGYIQDLEIPSLSSCTIVINSNILVTKAPFTADLTRVYKNHNIRTASISGTYSYEKSAEIKTNFESCVKLPGKC